MRIFHIQLDFATIVHIEDRQAFKNVKNALNLKFKLVQKANNTTDQQKYKTVYFIVFSQLLVRVLAQFNEHNGLLNASRYR